VVESEKPVGSIELWVTLDALVGVGARDNDARPSQVMRSSSGSAAVNQE
jgi:hypothetical protein